MRTPAPRGSVLIVAVIVVMVISVFAVGIIRYASAEVAGATGGAKNEELYQCAEAARQLLLSKFHLLGLDPRHIDAVNVTLDGPGGAVRAVGGHLNTVNVQVDQVVPLPAQVLGPTRPNDRTNIIPIVQIGGQPMKAMVHCQLGGDPGDPTSGRQIELEYGIKFGP